MFHQGLGLGTFVVGLVAGAQFGASLLSRFWAGEYADTRGARIALVCVLIEAAGQALIWLAPGPALALLGAAVTGFGYSLVYPGFGVEAVLRAPPQSRGLAMGAYTACLDLALGLVNPALGLVAGGAGLGRVYLVSTLVVLCATAIAVRLLTKCAVALYGKEE
jgi:predicted MFS family arabinose efflux permease